MGKWNLKRLLCALVGFALVISLCCYAGFGGVSVSGFTNGSAPTGDRANPVLLIAIVAVSLIGIVVVILLLKPKKKGKYQKAEDKK